jgi:hypothetical protein
LKSPILSWYISVPLASDPVSVPDMDQACLNRHDVKGPVFLKKNPQKP